MFSGKAKKLVAPNVLRVLYETWPADTRGHFAGRLVCEKDWGAGGWFAFNVYTRKFNPYALFQESSFCSDFPGFPSMRTYIVKLW